MADQIKMEVVLTDERALELVPDYDPEDASDRLALVEKVAEQMGLNSSAGGWVWKVTRRDSTTRLIGRFVPAGASVLA